MAPPARRILLLFGYYVYRIHLGIVQYARTANWELDNSMYRSGQLPRNWNVDGILTFGSKPEIVEAITASGLPVVDFNQTAVTPNWPVVANDNRGIGVTAAEHLLTRGYRNLAFLTWQGSLGEELRFEGFGAAADAAGAAHYECKMSDLENWLRNAPLPVGIMANNDSYAIHVMRACSDLGLRIPEDVAIVGSGNDELECTLTPVPLSSVDERLEYRGFRAAEILDEMLDGVSDPPAVEMIQPGEVVVRQSTDHVAINHDKVRKALIQLREEFHEPITPEQIAGGVGMCRRQLDQLFKEYLNRTVSDELQRLRLGRAEHFLLRTDHQVNEIARLSGFSSSHHMISVFRRVHGKTPRRYRRDNEIKAQTRQTTERLRHRGE